MTDVPKDAIFIPYGGNVEFQLPYEVLEMGESKEGRWYRVKFDESAPPEYVRKTYKLY